MRYYSYHESSIETDEERVVTVSEEDIRKEYWPYWLSLKVKEVGIDRANTEFTFEDCLQEWIKIYWAWEVKE
jgi:hypothetical protein